MNLVDTIRYCFTLLALTIQSLKMLNVCKLDTPCSNSEKRCCGFPLVKNIMDDKNVGPQKSSDGKSFGRTNCKKTLALIVANRIKFLDTLNNRKSIYNERKLKASCQ